MKEFVKNIKERAILKLGSSMDIFDIGSLPAEFNIEDPCTHGPDLKKIHDFCKMNGLNLILQKVELSGKIVAIAAMATWEKVEDEFYQDNNNFIWEYLLDSSRLVQKLRVLEAGGGNIIDLGIKRWLTNKFSSLQILTQGILIGMLIMLLIVLFMDYIIS